MATMAPDSRKPLDAPAISWVDWFHPAWLRPYLRLMRADRPIGIWLLLWPCWASAALAVPHGGGWISLWHAVLFALGAIAMRGAGCAYNDIIDRDIDAKVARTAGRPVASGQIGVIAALVFMAGLCLIGFLVLLAFNAATFWLGLASLLPVALYPFAKRFMQWPQLLLGVAFNWGAFLGWTAAAGSLALAPVLLYAGCVLWTLGYDTIYAHQDKEDDAVLGIGSSALALGQHTRAVLGVFYGGALIFWALAGAAAGLGNGLLAGLCALLLHFGWQLWRVDVDDPDSCLSVFRSNRDAGAILVLAMLLGLLF